jgi:hypothetical protein
LTFVAAGQSTAGAQDLTTADEVIAKYIEAVGGRSKMDAVKTVKLSGKMSMGGMEIPVTMNSKRPASVRMDFSVQGMSATQAFDGKVGWSIMPFAGKTDPEKMSDEQMSVIKDQADIDGPLVDYKQKGHQVELAGKDEIEGAEVYKLKLTKKDGGTEYHFIDVEYFLPIKVKGKREYMGTEMEYETIYGDYKEVAGLLMPHSVQQGGGGMGGTFSVDKIEVNVPIDDREFAMPEVKAAAVAAPTPAAAATSGTAEEKKDNSTPEKS